MHNLIEIHSAAQGLLVYGSGALAGASFGLLVIGLDVAYKRVKK